MKSTTAQWRYPGENLQPNTRPCVPCRRYFSGTPSVSLEQLSLSHLQPNFRRSILRFAQTTRMTSAVVLSRPLLASDSATSRSA